MRKEYQQLLLIALLLGASGAYSQDDINDADLQTLLEDDSTKSTPEVKSEGSSSVEGPALPQSGGGESIDSLSSDTVDIETLENNDTPATATSDQTIDMPATDETADLEKLPDDSIPATIAAPSEDELETLKTDLADEGEFVPAPDQVPQDKPKKETKSKKTAEKKPEPKVDEPAVFDVGTEERELLSLAQNIQGQISDNEWNELATAAKRDSYTVVKNDWLFKISKRLFGSGYYYPKIWSLNSFITNPHFIEPGMILSFSTGSANKAPEVKLGEFTKEELGAEPGSNQPRNGGDLANFAEDAVPGWLDEKKELENQGIYFQYASEETLDDLKKAGEASLNKEYENYDPPKTDFEIIAPPSDYDKDGFDKKSKIFYSFKEGFYLSTFVSTNIVQDFGSITNGPDENLFFTNTMHAFVKFDETINALPGDKMSIYSAGGKVSQENSDREGFKYTIIGHIKLIRKIRDKWEVEFTDVMGLPQRGDRITVYTPKIDRITRTYNSRLVEAAIMGTFENKKKLIGFGDVVYIDRGRADGVEMGNVFEVYGFKDRLLKTNITDQPTYKLGELTVITLTDNFATVLVTNTTRDFGPGDIAMTKTKEAHLREMKAYEARTSTDKKALGDKDLEELDVELNVDNLNEDLLKEADKIQLTEDELAELERQEREKSVIKDSERDLKALERLETEIESAEKILNDSKLDEDKLLEGENLEDVEKKRGSNEQDSLDEIEENLGKRYIDEDLNSKDNPYGLTEFDVEEVDELLNVEKKEK